MLKKQNIILSYLSIRNVKNYIYYKLSIKNVIYYIKIKIILKKLILNFIYLIKNFIYMNLFILNSKKTKKMLLKYNKREKRFIY